MPRLVSRVAHNSKLSIGVIASALGGSSFADAAGWGACLRGRVCAADLSGDGAVVGFDLALHLGAWGACQ